jgi:trimeric autotransporter adhesin
MKRFFLFLGFAMGWLGLNVAYSQTPCVAPQQISTVASQDGKNAKVFFSNTGAASYTIEYRQGYDSTWTNLGSVSLSDSNSLYLKDLKPCSWYVVRVKANCAATISSEWRATEFKTGGCTVACPLPAGLFAAARDSIASLNWLSTNASAGYSIMWKAKRSTVWKTETATTNSLIVKGLLPCTEYEFKVKTVCGLTGSSDYSASKSFKTAGCVAPCVTPRDIKSEVGETKMGLYWASTSARAYEIQYKIASDSGTWTTVKSVTNTLIINGLRPCSKYLVQVRSLCSGDNSTTVLFSEWSSQIVVATTGCVTPNRCEPVRRLGFQPTANGAVLVWETVVGAKFQIQYKAKRDSLWKTVNATSSRYELTGLTSCTEYQYRVKVACANGGTSAWSNVMTFKTAGCQASCQAPKFVKTYAVDSVAVVTWAGVGATKFVLEYKVADAATWTSVNVTGNVHVLTGLKRCATYYVRVKSVCSTAAMSDYSEAKFTTGGCQSSTTCVAPRQLSGGADATSAKFAWSSTTDRGYIFEYKEAVDNSDRWISDSVRANYTAIFNLKPCTKYVARVRTICVEGVSKVSAPSELYYFSTQCSPNGNCVTPTLIGTQLVQDTTVYFAWKGTSAKYEVKIESASSSFSTVADSSTLKLTLKACQIYEWKVRAICANGSTSDWSESRKFETIGCRPNPTTCAAPINLKNEIFGTDSLQWATFSWASNNLLTVVEKYEIQYRISSSPISPWIADSITGYTYKALVRRCQVYEWKVRKICGNGSYSAWVSSKFETKGCAVTSNCPLTSFRVSASSNGSVSLFWENKVDSFIVQYRPSSDSSWKEMRVIATPNGVMLRDLVKCTQYKVRIRPICLSGEIRWFDGSFNTSGGGCLTDGGNGTDVQGLVVRNVVKGLGINPNPGNEYVQINYELQETTDVSISLMNLQGQVVSQYNGGKQDAGTYMQTLDNLSELNTGLYMLVIRANGKISVSQKWMKQ